MEISKRGRLDALTGLRGIAALIVVVYHCLPLWPHYDLIQGLFEYGYLAVPFFFCLSGFVMQWSWEQNPRPSHIFLIRRIARIYPVSLLGLVISVSAFHAIGTPLAGYVGGRHSISLSALLLQSWAYGTPDIRQSWDGVSWSLSCEILFYALSPLILPAVRRATGRSLTTALVLTLGIYYLPRILAHGTVSEDFWFFLPAMRLPEYVCGALTAKLVMNGDGPRISLNPALTALLFIAIPLFVATGLVPDVTNSALNRVVLLGFLLLLYVTAIRQTDGASSSSSILVSGPLVFLGDISYSLYMMHALVLGMCSFAINRFHWSVPSARAGEAMTILYAAIAVAFSIIVYYFVETPAYRLVVSRFLPVTSAGRSHQTSGTIVGGQVAE